MATLQGNQIRSQMLIRGRERASRALELYLRGATYQAVADELGWKHRSAAQRSIKRELDRRCGPPAEKVRVLEIQRCEELLREAWANYGNAYQHEKQDQKTGALSLVDRIQSRLNKLHGIDTTEKVRVSGKLDVEHRGTVQVNVNVQNFSNEELHQQRAFLQKMLSGEPVDEKPHQPIMGGNGRMNNGRGEG